MLIKPDSKIFLCKYYIRHFQVIINKTKTLDMGPDNVLSLEFFNDFERNIFSILKVVLKVDVQKKIEIYNNKLNLEVKLELEKIGYDVEIEKPVTGNEKVFSLLLVPYFEDDEENMDATVTTARRAQNTILTPSEETDNDENYFETQNTVELYLFNPELMRASKKVHNRIYPLTTLQNAVGEMLTASGHKNVLMSKFDNSELYPELFLPVKRVYENIMYLDQYFGFYKKGAVVFYDLDCLYIINANGKVTAKRKGEWTETTFLIPEVGMSIPGQGMLRNPGEQKFYCVVSEMEVNPQRGTVLKNESIGSNVKVVFTDGTEMNTFKTGASSIGGDNLVVQTVKKDSKYTGELMSARIIENEVNMYISATNLDMTAFTPNKTFRIVFDEPIKYKKYKGEYRIAYAYHLLRAESENFLSSTHHILLRKTK